MSYVPQADTQAVPFTVEQFVLMGRYPYLSPFSPVGRADREAVREAMALTGTAAFADRLLGTLSGGERQKVYIAAALAQGAPIMLLDEPTTFLDYHHQDEIRELLARTAATTGRTTVSVTHDVNRAALESDRIVALRDGRVVFDGRPEEIMRPDVLQRIYATPFLLVAHPETGLPMIVPRAASRGVVMSRAWILPILLLLAGAVLAAAPFVGMTNVPLSALWGKADDPTVVDILWKIRIPARADGVSGRRGPGHQRHGVPGDVPQPAGHAVHARRLQRRVAGLGGRHPPGRCLHAGWASRP